MKKDLEQQIYFEDMEIGDKVVSVGRTITEADIVSFAGLTGDYNTLHTDAGLPRDPLPGSDWPTVCCPLHTPRGFSHGRATTRP